MSNEKSNPNLTTKRLTIFLRHNRPLNKKEEFMISKSKSRLIFSVIFILIVLLSNCGKTNTAKSLMVVENGQAQILGLSVGKDGSLPALWEPGTVVLFRTTETVKPQPMLKTPAGETGKAGEVYVITDDYKLRKIGDFDLNKSDDEFSKAFVKY